MDGDPTQDITLIQDSDNLLMIMKDGQCHKEPDAARLARRQQVSAPNLAYTAQRP